MTKTGSSKSAEKRAASLQFGETTYQKINGVFYTPDKLAKVVIDLAFNQSEKPIKTFLEPCVGGGAFLFAYLEKQISLQGWNLETMRSILEGCYVADNDEFAITAFRNSFRTFFENKYQMSLDFPESNILSGDSLFERGTNGVRVRNLANWFQIDKGFDLIATNPPYLLLKPDRRLGDPANKKILDLINDVKKSRYFELSEGIPNLYKLFVEVIAKDWVARDGIVSLLIPSSILKDRQSSKLRSYLLQEFAIGTILELPESARIFENVGQSFVAFSALKGQKSNSVVVLTLDKNLTAEQKSAVDLGRLKALTGSSAIGQITKTDMDLLSQFEGMPKLSEYPNVVNLRGELDISLDSKLVSESKDGIRIVYGNNIGLFQVGNSGKYASTEILARPKGQYSKRDRIVCQQISNKSSTRRLKWGHISPYTIVANSCNFVALDPESIHGEASIDLYFLLGVLNSNLMNKRFKILSSNNHISNWELSNLPIYALNSASASTISKLAEELLVEFSLDKFSKLNAAVNLNYGFRADWDFS